MPKLYAAGWNDDQISEQKSFTDGRIVVIGAKPRRRPAKRADYLLRYARDFMLAVVEGLLPSKIHLTVPANFRKRPVKNIVRHKSNLRESEIEKRDDLPVTAPLRTILDLARSHLDDERLTAVTKDAIQKGLVSRQELLNALAAVPKDIDPATQATLQIAARE